MPCGGAIGSIGGGMFGNGAPCGGEPGGRNGGCIGNPCCGIGGGPDMGGAGIACGGG